MIQPLKLEPQALSREVFLEKYAKQGEFTFAKLRMRVARALASVESDVDHWTQVFFDAMEAGYIPAGRTSSAAGTDIKATLVNCFVQPIADTMADFDESGKAGITQALKQAAETLRRGGGVGYNFSHLRPRGGWVSGTNSRSSGPISFMRMFNTMCETVESAGARRGAQMGVLRCDHPDIEEFIHAKDKGDLTNFNISVGVTDAFMEAVESDTAVQLVHVAKPHQDLINANGCFQREDGMWVYRTVRAMDLWNQIMESTYDHAEPGILFLDRMNQENNLWYCETIEATNPCAEEPLPDYGCCCLGSIDLTRFVRDPFTPNANFDMDAYRQTIRVAVRMLDNVLDVTYWPLPEQHAESVAKRRIGLGYLGLGNALTMLGIGYNTEHGYNMAARLTEEMRDVSYLASVDLAIEKGAFPKLDIEQYLASGFAKRLPDSIREAIRANGIRNSHLMAIAPTGTISLAFADNASNGIEPPFTWSYTRRKRMDDGTTQSFPVTDHAYRLYSLMVNGEDGDLVDHDKLPASFISALEMSAKDHMRMLEVVQPFVDTSISKTVNVPADYPYDDFKDLYLNGWKAGLKGLATYRPNNVLGAVLSVSETPKAEASAAAEEVSVGELKDVDPLTINLKSRPAGDLPAVTRKMIYYTMEGAKKIYLSVSFIRVDGVLNGQLITVERPIEFFVPAGQRDDSQQWVAAAMRLLSQVARSGSSVADALADMREVIWDKGLVRYGTTDRADGSTGPRQHESEVAAIAYALQEILRERGFLDAKYRARPLEELATVLFRAEFTESVAGSTVSFLEHWSGKSLTAETANINVEIAGRRCPECGSHTLIKVDGCQKCTSCGYIGSCG